MLDSAEDQAERAALIREFLVECNEGLDKLDQDLVSLEEDPRNIEVLSGIFRTFHTIKGTAGFLAFHKLESVAHSAENLLSKLREGTLKLNTGRADALGKTVDTLRAILASVETTRSEGDADYAELLDNLRRFRQPDQDGFLSSGGAPPARIPTVEASPATAVVHSEPSESAPGTLPRAAKPNAVDTSIRVDVQLLDSIMNLVGELVLTRNQIVQHTASDPSSTLATTSQRLNLITSELQESVMKTRMQPIRNVWSKFPRIVRDLTAACSKRATLVMEGEDTELDRAILEAIKDPLTHMVRNSVDHGIESVADRLAAGKPAEGTLRLQAYHEGGQVNLELADDGHGIDVERVKAKAIERGLLTLEKAARMSDREAQQIVFLPGFSTASAVTNVSGRGVGMDVVCTNIEKIGGSVDIQSAAGVGTTLRIKIPLTLAIIAALLVTADGCRFAIPQVSLIELVRLEGARVREAIEDVHGAPVYRLRGELLPRVDLRSELGFSQREELARVDDQTLDIVVLQADDRQYGLIVDAVNDTEEIVVKPLEKQIREIPVYAGTTILGDGRVALILDATGIAKRAGVLADGDRRIDKAAVESDGFRLERGETLLLVDLDEKRAAIPLTLVSRLKEIAVDRIKTSGDYFVNNYRGRIMPLVWLSETAGAAPARVPGSRLQIVVHTSGDHCVGLVAGQIHDIVEAKIDLDPTTRRRDTLGSALIQGRVTDLLDVASIVARAIPAFADQAPAKSGARAS